MKNLFIILLLLPVAAAGTVERPPWKDMPLAVPANEKDGHAYRIAIDNIAGKNIYGGIAVALVGDEILFGYYDVIKDGGCAVFHSPRGTQTICNGEFFLLHEDFARFKRLPIKGGIIPSAQCTETLKGTLVEYKGYYLVLDRPDLSDLAKTNKKEHDMVKHAKFIGTFFKHSGEFTYYKYTDNTEFKIPHFESANVANKDYRFEVLCRVQFTDD